MRLLHTSDWHVGRTFHGVDLLVDQARSLAAIAELVAEESVDVVVVPGDVYDRSIPSADAIAVCTRGLEAIRAAGAVIVATSGNHDSPARLGAGASFAAAGGLYLRTRLAEADRPIVLRDDAGEVAFYGIPYLEPEVVRGELGVPRARSHAEVLDVVMDRVRADLAGRPGMRSVVLAHAFVVGGAATGSERSISVGGVETVPLSAFDGVDYVALGHLHSPQTLSASVRYSGSPLPYSFGEASHRKAVWIIDLDESGVAEVRRRDLPVVRGLSRLTGTLEELLSDPAHEDAVAHYVSATLTDTARPIDAMRRLRNRFPHAVHVEWVRPDADSVLHYRERVRGRDDAEVARSFLTDVRGEPSTAELRWLERALAAGVTEPEGAAVLAGSDAAEELSA
ncbi:exonuclease SbcCD subunit D [Nocardia farcinica]|uniref:exonuclease SbcCD subunit D n=1 Tax=Nocardia farcinica TaxID=37329 RepID=UPI0018951D44|nr:exonuclease SbcCD subunit D C-terminal domain-containing protein [Nocardia farcinica]MBF6143332.1 exonuclease SbcCD subunit D C-terminal domain-containing protein [Nocardia farcinica]MBF6386353.1 exonuclease SbcCD subunit D C-terminal domain-containing protein [Nocardia farcinica]MBF6535580.1 exonuclease SbcCD subunit D C-terminal domain-containing protein [Nocardia farcinica]